MHHQNNNEYNNQSYFLDREFKISPPRIDFEKRKRILILQGLTGLNYLINYPEIFEDTLNFTDDEIIFNFLNDKFDLSLGENNPFEFILNTIGISLDSLILANADNEEFYHHLTMKHALTSILIILLGKTDNTLSYNGFPRIFQTSINQINKSQKSEGMNYFPFSGNVNNINHNQLLFEITKRFNFKFNYNNLFFHGTTWGFAISINDKIKIIQRDEASDFGLKNFYLTNNFKTSVNWCKHYSTQSVVIFYIPDEFLDNLNRKELINIDEWKDVIFTCRNNPEKNNSNYLKEERTRRTDQYINYLNNLDSYDLISGPICTNPGVENKNELKYLSYGDDIPYQYSFKESTKEFLNEFIVDIVFFMK